MMDFADVYMQHSHQYKAGAGHAAAPPHPTVHELVGGTLAAQAYADRLAALEGRVGTFEEKLINLTRLIKLSQGLQAEREAELRRDNEELRARVARQEHATATLARELAAARDACGGRPLGEALRALGDESQLAARTAEAAAERAEAAEHEHTHLEQELDETKVWTRRNLQRLKEHVDVLNSGLGDVRGTHGDLSTRLERMDCRAELEYKKLRVVLQQKATEADAMAALLEKEFKNVRRVAQRHEVLGTAEVNPTLDTLKFA